MSAGMNGCAVVAGALLVRDGDDSFTLGGAQLRRHCRCADCRARALRGDAAAVAGDVAVVAVSPLGYGVQLHFSDGHDRGIFPWNYLRQIATRAE